MAVFFSSANPPVPLSRRDHAYRCIGIADNKCGYPSKKALDLRAIDEKLSKRHRSSDARLPLTPSSVTSPLNPSQRPQLAGSSQPGPSAPASTSSGPRLYDDGPTSLDALHALCRMTTMGSFFSAPTAPPDFLREQFSDPDELRCVSCDARSAPLLYHLS